jgi:hypothetical protein
VTEVVRPPTSDPPSAMATAADPGDARAREPGSMLVDRQRLALAVDALWRYEAEVARVAAGPARMQPVLEHFGAVASPASSTAADRESGERLALVAEQLIDALAVVRPGPVPEAPPSPVTRRRWRHRWLAQIAELDAAVVAAATAPDG